jgi:hypothetical protein
MPRTKESGISEEQYLEAHAQGWRDAEAFYQAERDALREALEECVDWLESRPDFTEGDAVTASRARVALERPE